jgi:hypothetical protein
LALRHQAAEHGAFSVAIRFDQCGERFSSGGPAWLSLGPAFNEGRFDTWISTLSALPTVPKERLVASLVPRNFTGVAPMSNHSFKFKFPFGEGEAHGLGIAALLIVVALLAMVVLILLWPW